MLSFLNMIGKRGIVEISLDDGPLLSPPPNLRVKKAKLEFKQVIELLEEDEKLVTAIDVPHEYSYEFKLQRLVLPDQTETSYLICRSPHCADLPYKKKVRINHCLQVLC